VFNADAMELANVRRVRVACRFDFYTVTRSGTGFTLSGAVYQGIRRKNRK
jgi:hypothetical protein